MTSSEIREALRTDIELCRLHLSRMEFANKQLEGFLPLTFETYNKLDAFQISYIDQYLFRFAKLQDTMGGRLFPNILEALAEPVDNMAFIDILNRLEKLEVIETKKSWLEMRKMRNSASHEYQQTINERIEGINLLFEQFNTISNILDNCKNLARMKGVL
jgi:hypothetical protein